MKKTQVPETSFTPGWCLVHIALLAMLVYPWPYTALEELQKVNAEVIRQRRHSNGSSSHLWLELSKNGYPIHIRADGTSLSFVKGAKVGDRVSCLLDKSWDGDLVIVSLVVNGKSILTYEQYQRMHDENHSYCNAYTKMCNIMKYCLSYYCFGHC